MSKTRGLSVAGVVVALARRRVAASRVGQTILDPLAERGGGLVEIALQPDDPRPLLVHAGLEGLGGLARTPTQGRGRRLCPAGHVVVATTAHTS